MDPENCACSSFILALLRTKLHFGLLQLLDVFEVGSQLCQSLSSRLSSLSQIRICWERKTRRADNNADRAEQGQNRGHRRKKTENRRGMRRASSALTSLRALRAVG